MERQHTLTRSYSAPLAHPRTASPMCRHPDRVLISQVGLSFPDSLSFEEWERAGRQVSRIADTSAWCLGDWVIYGQSRYIDRYQRAIKSAGLDYQTLRNYAWVARRFEPFRRRPGLSFQHHAEAASLPPGQQDYWLDRAERHSWSRNQLRQHIRAAVRGQRKLSPDIVLPNIKLTRDRIERWHAAAARMVGTFEDWIVSSLDEAAALALNSDPSVDAGAVSPSLASDSARSTPTVDCDHVSGRCR